MELKQRTQNFIEELGLPLSQFAKRVELCPDSVRKWLNGELRIKPETETRIDNFLKKFGR